MSLKLETTAGTKRHPDRSEVSRALRDHGWANDSFVILSRSDSDYVQVGGGSLEIRRGDEHRRWDETPAPRDAAERVFMDFYESSGKPWLLAEWTDVTEEVSTRARGHSVLALAIALGLIAAIGAWFAMRG
ncbi:MAG: hypothetical protein JNG88_11580 [Phycisphaerales bacterium]|nr:hypothetical protein [Phycisphaerales bacterium]